MADFSNVIADIFNTIGDDAIFTPAGGAPVDCKVDLVTEVDSQPHQFSTTAWAQGKTIEAILSVIGKEPDRGDIFTIDGTDYTVEAVVENDGYCVKVVVK